MSDKTTTPLSKAKDPELEECCTAIERMQSAPIDRPFWVRTMVRLLAQAIQLILKRLGG